MIWALAAVAAVAAVGGSDLASVDRDGDVHVWRAETGVWTAIYRCRRAPVDPRRLAWAGSVLFVACPGEPMARWEVGTAGAVPVVNRALARRRPAVLGSGPDALFFAENRAVWRYRPHIDLVERVATAPAWPLAALGETPIGLVARAGDRCWQWRRGRWRRLLGAPGKPHSSTALTSALLCEERFAVPENYTQKLAKTVRVQSGSHHILRR